MDTNAKVEQSYEAEAITALAAERDALRHILEAITAMQALRTETQPERIWR